MFTKAEKDWLIVLLDREGLPDLIDEISAICFDKSEKTTNLYWLKAGEYLEKCAEKLEHGNV